jgi:hypothetical protein
VIERFGLIRKKKPGHVTGRRLTYIWSPARKYGLSYQMYYAIKYPDQPAAGRGGLARAQICIEPDFLGRSGGILVYCWGNGEKVTGGGVLFLREVEYAG